MNERDFIVLVERNREEVPVGHPPTDLLEIAHATRRQRRLKGLGMTVATLVVLGAAGLGAHALTTPGASSAAGAPHASLPSGTSVTLDPTTESVVTSTRAIRPVGINGWTVNVPAVWGTDQVGCDRTTPTRPTVVFAHHERVPPRCHPTPTSGVPSVHISGETVGARPWRTVSDIAVHRIPPTSSCRTCSTLTVPHAGATFQIHARTVRQLHAIEHSLHPLSTRSITVPVWQVPAQGPAALDQMTAIALADGLHPQSVERPSRARPGRFLESIPPLGTPVDLGRGITIVYSAGDLTSHATTRSLRRHGWKVTPARSFMPPVTRAQAGLKAGTISGSTPGGADTFLRTLSIGHSEPASRHIQGRLAWLVVGAVHQHGGQTTCTITAVDADSGRVIESRGGFVGRR